MQFMISKTSRAEHLVHQRVIGNVYSSKRTGNRRVFVFTVEHTLVPARVNRCGYVSTQPNVSAANSNTPDARVHIHHAGRKVSRRIFELSSRMPELSPASPVSPGTSAFTNHEPVFPVFSSTFLNHARALPRSLRQLSRSFSKSLVFFVSRMRAANFKF